MKWMDIKVYKRYRKHPYLPDYETDVKGSHQHFSNVPIFVLTSNELDAAICLEDVEQIQQNRHQPLLILTDRKRILVVDPQGYDYARYVCTIDMETAKAILNKV